MKKSWFKTGLLDDTEILPVLNKLDKAGVTPVDIKVVLRNDYYRVFYYYDYELISI